MGSQNIQDLVDSSSTDLLKKALNRTLFKLKASRADNRENHLQMNALRKELDGCRWKRCPVASPLFWNITAIVRLRMTQSSNSKQTNKWNFLKCILRIWNLSKITRFHSVLPKKTWTDFYIDSSQEMMKAKKKLDKSEIEVGVLKANLEELSSKKNSVLSSASCGQVLYGSSIFKRILLRSVRLNFFIE